MYGTLNILTQPTRDTSSVDQSDSQDDAGGRHVQICLDGRNLLTGYRDYMAKWVFDFLALQGRFLNTSMFFCADYVGKNNYGVGKEGKF